MDIEEVQDKIIEEVVKAVEPENTGENRNPDGTFKKGFSGNPDGRPKGSGMTLKEWVSRKLKDMTDEEKLDFIKDIPKDMQWRMAEGNPKQDTDVTSGGEKITPIYGNKSVSGHNSNQTDIQPDQENQSSERGDGSV